MNSASVMSSEVAGSYVAQRALSVRLLIVVWFDIDVHLIISIGAAHGHRHAHVVIARWWLVHLESRV